MRFPKSFLDELRQKIPISKIIGRRVKFDRAKSNIARGDHWACCPFHNEKTPSFHCEDDKGRYYCFGCGAAGDHIKFLVEHENLSFPEAVEELAKQAGMKIPVMNKEQQEKEKQKASLYDVMDLATKFFQEQLQSTKGTTARAYLRERGLSPSLQETFAIGYAPAEKNALKKYLIANNISQKQIEACGLVVFGDDIAVSYDRFRERLMFPIKDSNQRIIAFGGRALSATVPAKYINSPQTELFSKSNVLYNYANARRACKKGENLIIAEGYMDVIALHKAGFENAVAPLGTALTPAHIELAWRVGKNPYLCFDGDEAGVRAAHRTIDICLPKLRPGYSVNFAMLPENKDPDDLINESGKQAFAALIKQSTNLIDMLWRRETQGITFEKPEQRAELEPTFKQLYNSIENEIVRKHYQQELLSRLDSFFGTTNQKNKTSFSKNFKKNKNIVISDSLVSSLHQNRVLPPLRETALVITIANHPQIVFDCLEEFSALQLENKIIANIKSALLNFLSESASQEITAEQVKQHLIELGFENMLIKLQVQLKNNGMWQCLQKANFYDAKQGWQQALSLHRRSNELHRELKLAEANLAENGDEDNFKQLVSLKTELSNLDGTKALIEGFGEASGRQIRPF